MQIKTKHATYLVTNDPHNWILNIPYIGVKKDKDTGEEEPMVKYHQTYHKNLSQVLQKIIDIEMKTCKDVLEIKDMLDEILSENYFEKT